VGIRKLFLTPQSAPSSVFLCESLIIVAFFQLYYHRYLFSFALPFLTNWLIRRWLYCSSTCILMAIISFQCNWLVSTPARHPMPYPASSFKPVKVLNCTFKINSLAAIPRKIFCCHSLAGIDYPYHRKYHNTLSANSLAKTAPWLYTVNSLVAIPMITHEIQYKIFNVVQDELKNDGAIVSMAAKPGFTNNRGVWGGIGGLEWRGKDPNSGCCFFPIQICSVDFGKTVGWQFIAGRDFKRVLPPGFFLLVYH